MRGCLQKKHKRRVPDEPRIGKQGRVWFIPKRPVVPRHHALGTIENDALKAVCDEDAELRENRDVGSQIRNERGRRAQ
jgi:hypothetical protein